MGCNTCERRSFLGALGVALGYLVRLWLGLLLLLPLWTSSGVVDFGPFFIILLFIIHLIAIQPSALVFVGTPHWGVGFSFDTLAISSSSSSVHF